MDILFVSERSELLHDVSEAFGSKYQVKMLSKSKEVEDACDFLLPTDKWIDLILFDLEISDGTSSPLFKIAKDVNQEKGIPLIFLAKETSVARAQEVISSAGEGYLLENQLAEKFPANIAMYQRWCERAKRLANAEYDLTKFSLIDQITQLPNARSFDQEMVRVWCQLKREKQPLSLILLDIDHFERYVQVYGQASSDETLRLIALLIDGSLSRPLDSVARLAGSVFAMLLPNTEGDGALKVAQVAMRHLREAELPFVDGAEKKKVTVSMVAASFGYDWLKSKTTVQLLQTVRDQLSQAKEKGGDLLENFVLEGKG